MKAPSGVAVSKESVESYVKKEEIPLSKAKVARAAELGYGASIKPIELKNITL
jgi:hypothetical protein